MDEDQKESIAIVGAGVAGLTAAYLLQHKFRITLFEKNNYFGGHTNTVEVINPNGKIAVDTGFIVMNHQNYPLFTELLHKLDVELIDSNMSFGHYDLKSNFFYNTDTLSGLLSQKRNIFSPSFYILIYNILRFFKKAKHDLENKKEHRELSKLTLGEYLTKNAFPQVFINSFLIPMGSAIWSTPTNQMLNFPLLSFLRFYKNHGLLSVTEHPQWKVIKGGSNTYVKKILKEFKGEALTNSEVKSVIRNKDNITVELENNKRLNFDKVILAGHANESFKLLSDPSDDEKLLLSTWEYSINDTYLHTDESLLPPKKSAWASWNFCRGKKSNGDEALTLTYNMNKLQCLESDKNYFVTLNPNTPIDPGKIIKKIIYTHPRFTFESMATQKNLSNLNGERNTYYCGSYFGHGFHEDAVRSGVEVAAKLGVFFP